MSRAIQPFLLSILLLAAGVARAAVVPLDTTVPFSGGLATSIPFSVSAPGRYSLQVTDHGATLATIPRTVFATANVTQGSAIPLAEVVVTQAGAPMARSGFQATPGSYAVNLIAQAGNSPLGGGISPGQLGVQVSAVPLPPAAVLFAGSLIALAAVGRRKRSESA